MYLHFSDHTLEINLLDKLIGGGAKKLGVSAGELCSRLFPPGNIGSTRASEVKSIMEDQSVSYCTSFGFF